MLEQFEFKRLIALLVGATRANMTLRLDITH